MYLLQLADLDMPLGSLTYVVTPPHLVLEVLVGLTLCQINVTLFHTSFSLMPKWSQCLRPATFDELTKAPSWIISSSYRRRTLCPRGKMPQQFVLRLFIGFKCVDFKKSPLLTFEPAIIRSLLLVVPFGDVESTSTIHFLVGVSPLFRTRKNNLSHPQLMIGFWRVLTSLVGSHRRCQYWCCVNQIQVCLASLELVILLSRTKRCLDRWSEHVPPKLKLESSKSESNCFEWLYVCIPFSCFSRDFYRTYGVIVIALIVHSCISCIDDRRRGGY